MSPTTTVEAFAPAKINLTLHVTGRRDDGYHLLDSLVVFAQDVGDRAFVEAADELTLSVTGPHAEGVPTDGENLVLRAAERLRELRGVASGARIVLEKHLPHGAGIGGGSADAAAAIRALAEIWGVSTLTTAEAIPLGADVPVCLAGPGPQMMRGIGERVEAFGGLPDVSVVLVNPGVPLPTQSVFKALEAAGNPAMSAMSDSAFNWLVAQRNDLEAPAMRVAPVIGDVLSALRSAGARLARMSGSGATCFGVFDEPAAAVKALRDAHPDWWIRPTRIV